VDATHTPAQPSAADGEDLRCALYRFYAADDTLLYIGITQELPTRLKVHDGTKPWYHQVAYIKVEHFDTRDDALEAEEKAIRAEQPLHNVTHNPVPRRRPRRPAPIPIDLVDPTDVANWPRPGAVAVALGLGRTTVHDLLTAGRIRYTTTSGGHRRCHPGDVRQMIEDRQRVHTG
jgi:excisionase family DNA binding protein